MMNKLAKLTNMTKAPLRVPGLRLYVPAGSSITLTAYQTDRMFRSRTDRRELQDLASLNQMKLEILMAETPATEEGSVYVVDVPVPAALPETRPVLDGDPPVLVEPPVIPDEEPKAPESSESDVPVEPQDEPTNVEQAAPAAAESPATEVPSADTADTADKGRKGKGRKPNRAPEV